MKKIAIVSTFYQKKGGISTFIKNIEKEFNKNNKLHATIISPDTGDGSWPKNRMLISIKTCLLLRKIKPDEVHCHCTWYLQLGAILFGVFNKKMKIISFKHSDVDIQKANSVSGKIKALIDLKSSKVIFISEYLKMRWAKGVSKKYGSAASIKVGVAPAAPRVERNNHEPQNITYVGLFEYPGKVKGLELLIDSFSEYCKKFKDTTTVLNVMGDGRLKEKVIHKVIQSDSSNQIKIFDNIENPQGLYLMSSLHCHITYQDAMPIVILEALSHGIPVLASRMCGIPEIDAEGLMLIENNPTAIANEIHNLLKNPPKVKLSYKHSWDAVANDILKITSRNK